MPTERVALPQHTSSIQAEYDPKKLAALIDELIRVLDEERAIKAEIDIQTDAVIGNLGEDECASKKLSLESALG